MTDLKPPIHNPHGRPGRLGQLAKDHATDAVMALVSTMKADTDAMARVEAAKTLIALARGK